MRNRWFDTISMLKTQHMNNLVEHRMLERGSCLGIRLHDFLFADCEKNSVANISHTRLEHSVGRQLSVNPCDPNLYGLRPFGSSTLYTLNGGDDRQNDNLLDAPFLQGLNGSNTRTTGGDDGVDDDGKARDIRTCVKVLREVVVVLDRLKSAGFTV